LREIHRSIYRKKQITKTVDPWWKLLRERLTHEIADHAWKLIEEVEEWNDQTIEAGIPKLRKAAARKQQLIADKILL
jgi:methylmalonyl-CoA mutase